MGISLAALAGMPPSPLFLSELLIVLGGVAAGQLVVSGIAVIALALGFLGLLHALVEGVIGDRQPDGGRPRAQRGQAATVTLTTILGIGLLALLATGHAAASAQKLRRDPCPGARGADGRAGRDVGVADNGRACTRRRRAVRRRLGDQATAPSLGLAGATRRPARRRGRCPATRRVGRSTRSST